MYSGRKQTTRGKCHEFMIFFSNLDLSRLLRHCSPVRDGTDIDEPLCDPLTRPHGTPTVTWRTTQ